MTPSSAVHLKMHDVVVTDARDGADETEFLGQTQTPNVLNDETAKVWVYFDRESGFGADVGEFKMMVLKKRSDGRFGA